MYRAHEIAADRAALFRRSSDTARQMLEMDWPPDRSTAWWLARQMLEMDWVERHEYYNRIAETKPQRFATMLQKSMSPQDLLKGKRTSMAAPGCLVMIDKKRERQRQMKIEDYFSKRPR